MCAVKICETNLLGLRPIRASLGLRYITFRKNAPSSKHFYSCYNVLRKDLARQIFWDCVPSELRSACAI